MKTTTAAVRALLAKAELQSIELLEIYLDSPFTTPTYRFAKWTSEVTYDGETYTPMVWSRSPIMWSTTSQDQRMSFRLDNVTRELSHLLFTHEISGGRVKLFTVFSSLLTNAADTILLFDGSFSTPSCDELSLTLDAVSWLTRHGSVQLPRRIYQKSCNYRLGEPGCGIDMTAAANIQASSVEAGSTDRVLVDSALLGITQGLTSDVDRYWDEGVVAFTSGENNGQARPLKWYASADNKITLRFPFLNTPAAGDTYTIQRGCRKTKEDCNSRFANLVNFGGFAETPGRKQSLA